MKVCSPDKGPIRTGNRPGSHSKDKFKGRTKGEQGEKHLVSQTREEIEALGVQQASSSLSNTALISKQRRNRRFRRHKGKQNTAKHKDDKVVLELSSVELSESETSLLSKGLGFCPRPKSYDRGKLVEDTNAFSRRLRLKSHFHSFPDTHIPRYTLNLLKRVTGNLLSRFMI